MLQSCLTKKSLLGKSLKNPEVTTSKGEDVARKTKRISIFLKDEQLQELNRISRTRIAPLLKKFNVQRFYCHIMRIQPYQEVTRKVGVARDAVYKCIDKALEMGVESALEDLYHRPNVPIITLEAKARLVNIACRNPKDFGMAAELWT